MTEKTVAVEVLKDVDWVGVGKVPAGTWLIKTFGGGEYVKCRLKSDCDARLAGMGLEADLSACETLGNGGDWIMYAARRPSFAEGCGSLVEYRLKCSARNEPEDRRASDFFAHEERRRRSRFW